MRRWKMFCLASLAVLMGSVAFAADTVSYTAVSYTHLDVYKRQAGANSIFHGDKLLTTKNATVNHDEVLFAKLGIKPES